MRRSRHRVWLAFFPLVIAWFLIAASTALAAGSSYPPDAFDAGDDSPVGATDITTALRSTGAGSAPWSIIRHLSDADASSTAHDPDWYRFDVSAQEIAGDYSYLFEAVEYHDPRVNPVIEIYGPFALASSVSYQYGHNFPQATTDSLAIAGNTYAPWLNWVPAHGQSTNLGASLEFRPTTAGTYWIRVRPYGDNTGSNYQDGAGPYRLSAKIGMSTRVAGADRFETAVAVSRGRFADDQLDGTNGHANLSAAVVVNGLVFPDALAASSLAGICQGPVLLTRRGTLPGVTEAELSRLDPDVVYIVGGTAAVSDSVKSQIEAAFPSGDPVSVQRLPGADRIETAILVARKTLGLSSQTPVSPPGFAFICNAYSFADALSCAPMAAANCVPILLTPGGGLDSRVSDEITARSITDVVIVGGTGVISPSTESALKAKLGANNVLRLAGADRYETSKEFSAWAAGFPGGGNVGTAANPNALRPADRRRIGLCTGQDFPDALAAGPFCGDDWNGTPKPLLLTPGSHISPWVSDVQHSQLGPGQTSYLEDVFSLGGPTVLNRTYLFGGSGVLHDTVWWGIDNLD